MNRRDLLKALIASPVAALALPKAATSTPAKTLGDWEVTERIGRAPVCSYKTHRPPELGQQITIEHNGEIVFSGRVQSVTTGTGDGGCSVHAVDRAPVFYR